MPKTEKPTIPEVVWVYHICIIFTCVNNTYMWNVDMEKDGEDQLESKSQQLWSSESSQWKSPYHQHDKSTKTQMAWACSPTWCVIARHSRRQDDWETYEREKETTADEQHMWGIWNSKGMSWRQISAVTGRKCEIIVIVIVIDVSQWWQSLTCYYSRIPEEN